MTAILLIQGAIGAADQFSGLEKELAGSFSVLLMLGDRDKMVTLEETVEDNKWLPKAQLAVLPNTTHPIEMVDPARLAHVIRSFLA